MNVYHVEYTTLTTNMAKVNAESEEEAIELAKSGNYYDMDSEPASGPGFDYSADLIKGIR